MSLTLRCVRVWYVGDLMRPSSTRQHCGEQVVSESSGRIESSTRNAPPAASSIAYPTMYQYRIKTLGEDRRAVRTMSLKTFFDDLPTSLSRCFSCTLSLITTVRVRRTRES